VLLAEPFLMADNYLQFCITVPFNAHAESKWFEETMVQLAIAVIVEQWKNKKSPLAKSSETKALLKRFTEETWEFVDFQFDITKPSPEFPCGRVIIFSDECGNPHQVAAVLEAYLQKFQPKGVLTFSWAYTCSKMRSDQFGGGAAVITAEGSKFIDALDWASDLAAKFMASTPR
jgi:hypothetical protein